MPFIYFFFPFVFNDLYSLTGSCLVSLEYEWRGHKDQWMAFTLLSFIKQKETPFSKRHLRRKQWQKKQNYSCACLEQGFNREV